MKETWQNAIMMISIHAPFMVVVQKYEELEITCVNFINYKMKMLGIYFSYFSQKGSFDVLFQDRKYFVVSSWICSHYLVIQPSLDGYFTQVPVNWSSYYWPQRNERLSRPWSHPEGLNWEHLNFQSNALATRLRDL